LPDGCPVGRYSVAGSNVGQDESADVRKRSQDAGASRRRFVYGMITDRLRRYSYQTKYLKVTDLMKSIVVKDLVLVRTDRRAETEKQLGSGQRRQHFFSLPKNFAMCKPF
jgi:argininosuccinate synthase